MEYQSFPFTLSVYPVICGVFVCFLTLGLYFKHTSQAIHYCLFLGTIPSLLCNSDRVFEWMTEAFTSLGRGSFYMDGPVFSKYRFLVTCHPENLEYILKTNFDNFPKGENFREIFTTLGIGIFNVDSDTWRLQRKLAHAGLIVGEFKDLVAHTSRKVVEEQLVPLLAHVAEQEGCSIDLQDVFSRYAYDINMGMIFGRYENYLYIGLPSNEMAGATDDAQRALLYRNIVPAVVWKFQRFFRIGSERAIIKAQKMVDESFTEYILQKRIDLLAGVETDDLLSIYIKALADNTSVYASLARKDSYLKDEMLNLFLAGRDTITSALTWFFWLVSTTPSVKAKILEELDCALSLTRRSRKWPCAFRSDDLKGLVYLQAALCESLRLYPPLPLNRKSVVKKDILPDGSVVTPGMEILLSIYSVGRMPWIWGENCLEFKPERWIAGNGKLIADPASRFLAFNFGARSCLGKDTASTQIKSVVAAVLFNFHIEVVEGHHACPQQGTTLYMKNGLQVNVKKRKV